ncbi:sugar ABC transporter permease [Nonomuraea sp. MCN248]|uniref:Sugar ABC transporter permease n=1 Tax=Nonomuraea corallina TaxID=2989783 RepID=A0ABT4SET7_9ACTN|nr:sugar ABC transporter permease [Nonomuraea corallina]MDA0635723.1 sugar ABC transporter permease [Nonomuraea corallina]
MTSRTSDSPAPAPALGWLLLMPAVLGMLITLVLPTVLTIGTSLRSGGLYGPGQWAGLDNYVRLLADDTFWPALGFTLSVTVMPLLVALVVAPLLALALDRGGTWVRRAGRILLSLSLVAFSPAAVAVSWLRGLRADAGGPAALAGSLADPATAPGTLRLIVAAATFGLVCALAVMAFLPALRGDAGVTPAMLTVGGIVALAAVAAGLQLFTLAHVLTGGGPLDSTQTLAILQYTFTWRAGHLGLGATLATVTCVIVWVLGIAATILAVASRMRLTLTPAPGREALSEAVPAPAGPVPYTSAGSRSADVPYASHLSGSYASAGSPVPGASYASAGSPHAPGKAHAPDGPYAPGGVDGAGPSGRRPSAGGVAVGVVALAVVTVAAVAGSLPWLSGLFEPGDAVAGPNVHLNTWLPALAGALVSVGVAYLGALGIGGLRPLGRRSEWLLLPFAPWLFVGPGPLAIANWNTVRGLGLVDTFAALVPPLLVSVPALLVLTLLCKGLAERNTTDLLSGVVKPSLPMAGILVVAVTLVNAQQLLWPLLVTQQPDLATAPLAQSMAAARLPGGAVDVGLATPLVPMALALAAVVAAQLLYLDRLALTVGRGTGSRPPVQDA